MNLPGRARHWGFIAAALWLCAGCASYGPEELERLKKEDPSFAQLITSRDQIHGEIRAIKQDLLVRKKAADVQVDKIRGDYDLYAKAQNEKIEKYRSTIEASRNLMSREIETASKQLEAKITELAGYQKTLAEVRKMLRDSRELNLSGKSRQKWEERAMMLSEKMRPLAEEIQDLRSEIRLKKRKIYFVR
ncbi:MAG: hypothetical protein MOGMAGMI_00705 [Candidatus Omnitrophica bacterium]|nr:hypothetical protein [Candidatus Omnitrophota bacterium]